MNAALQIRAGLAGAVLAGLGWLPVAWAQQESASAGASAGVGSALASTASSPASAPVLGVHPAPFIAISVADLDAQAAWYTHTLGFEISAQGSVPGRGIRYALLRQGAMLIELLQVPEARPRSVAARDAGDASRIHGFFKVGMVVDDVAGLYQRLKAQGVSFAFELGQPSGGPYRVFGLNDPEGNLLQFFGV
jgi:catechol 2,3-dioxygenase-like lactoylglutathione lyase family enzyme